MTDTDSSGTSVSQNSKKVDSKQNNDDSEDAGFVGDHSDFEDDDFNEKHDLLAAYQNVLDRSETPEEFVAISSYNGLADIAEETEDPTTATTISNSEVRQVPQDLETMTNSSNRPASVTIKVAPPPGDCKPIEYIFTRGTDGTEVDSFNSRNASPVAQDFYYTTVVSDEADRMVASDFPSSKSPVAFSVGIAGDEACVNLETLTRPQSVQSDPVFITELESRLQTAYTSNLGSTEHCAWLQFPSKPRLHIHVDTRMRERRHNSILLAPALELDEIVITGPSQRLILVGPRGAGRTTLLRRLTYQHSLRQLPNLMEFKILIYTTSVDLFAAARSDTFEVFLRAQLARYFGEEEFDVTLTWIRDNAHLLLFVVDVDSNHATAVRCQLLVELFTGASAFSAASLIIGIPITALTDVLDKLPCAPKVFDMVPWSDDDILKFLREFAAIFDEDDARTDFLEFIENLDCCKLLQTADNCSLICLLYYLDPDILCEKTIQSRTDLLDLLFIHLSRRHFPPPCLLTNAVLPFTEGCWELVNTGKTEGFVLKIPVSGGEVALASREFTEFLAAKYVALRYFHALLADQVGGSNQLEEALLLFRHCWDFDDMSYPYGRLCVFLSCLLRADYHQFLDVLATIFPDLSQTGKKECLRVCGECTQENQSCRSFVATLKTSIELSLGNEMAAKSNPYELFPSLQDGIDAQNLSSLKLNEATLTNDEALQHLPSCLQKAGKLRELEIDFTPLDPSITQRTAFSPNELDYDPLREVVNIIKLSRTLQLFSFSMKLDDMSLEAVDIVSSLFLETTLNNLTYLSANIHFKPSASLLKDDSLTCEAVELFISRFNDFIERNTSLLSLELSSCFLQHDLLTIVQAAIIEHPRLTTLSIKSSGDHESAAVIHPYASSVLADLIRCRDWLDLSFDLTGFLPSCRRSISMGYLSSRGSSRGTPRLAGVSGRSGLTNNGGGNSSSTSLFDSKANDDVDLLQSQVIRALQNHNTVRRIALQTRTFQPSLLDFLSDLIERCRQLSRLELSSEFVDDVLLLSIGCGVVCATQLESLVIAGSFSGVVNGGSLPGLFQSCSMSPRLREIHIKANPLSIRCLDSLVISLPDIPLFPTERLNVILEGQIICKDVKSVQKKVDKLRKHEFHQNFQLDVKLMPVKKSSDS